MDEIDVDQLKSLTPESNAEIVNPYNHLKVINMAQ
jgi:hypothetical protein